MVCLRKPEIFLLSTRKAGNANGPQPAQQVKGAIEARSQNCAVANILSSIPNWQQGKIEHFFAIQPKVQCNMCRIILRTSGINSCGLSSLVIVVERTG